MAKRKQDVKHILVGISLHPEVAKMLREFSDRTGIPVSRLVADWAKTHCKPEGRSDV